MPYSRCFWKQTFDCSPGFNAIISCLFWFNIWYLICQRSSFIDSNSGFCPKSCFLVSVKEEVREGGTQTMASSMIVNAHYNWSYITPQNPVGLFSNAKLLTGKWKWTVMPSNQNLLKGKIKQEKWQQKSWVQNSSKWKLQSSSKFLLPFIERCLEHKDYKATGRIMSCPKMNLFTWAQSIYNSAPFPPALMKLVRSS